MPQTNKQNVVRDANGRFAKGNPGGPGNPYSRNVAELRRLMLETINPQKLIALIDRLYELAIEGNIPAAKLILHYTVGKPGPAPEPDKQDLEEWNLFSEGTSKIGDAPRVLQSPNLDFLLDAARVCRPVAGKKAGRTLLDMFEADGRDGSQPPAQADDVQICNPPPGAVKDKQ